MNPDTSVTWPMGPPTTQVAEMVRALELTINRRLDGVLHGNHQGITPGHGSEPGESRLYQPGDDVRRIDWNVTARTQDTYVRMQIADRDLEAWLIVDTSAAMRFGTVAAEKSQIALAAAACIGFLTARNQNRLGALLVSGPHVKVMPPRNGRDQVRAVLSSIASAPAVDGQGRSDLGAACERVAAISKRRGFVAIVSDFHGLDWSDSLARLGMRHDLLCVAIHDPRERDIPPVGLIELVDPATGAHREIRVTADVQRRFAAAVAEQITARDQAIHRARAELIDLATDHDWLASIITHVRRKRMQSVNAQALRRP